jgi:hypothetical protein
MSDAVARIVGRELEFAMLREFLGADVFAGALVLTGGPGIGKTTLWEAWDRCRAGAGVACALRAAELCRGTAVVRGVDRSV